MMPRSNASSKSVPKAAPIATLMTRAGDTSTAVSNSYLTFVDLADPTNDKDYHEGILRLEALLLTTVGSSTPPGGAKYQFFYAFTSEPLQSPADAPTLLSGIKATLNATPNSTTATYGTGTFTFTGLPIYNAPPLTAEGIVIGGIRYTYVETLTKAYDVLIGADVEETLDNTAAAINGDTGEGTLYGTGTIAHPKVSASVADPVLTLTFKAPYSGSYGSQVALVSEVIINAATASGATMGNGANGHVLAATSPFLHEGRYLYVWYSRDAFSTAVVDATLKLIRL